MKPTARRWEPGKSAHASCPQALSPNSANQLISLVRLKIIDGRLVPSRIPAIADLTLLLAMMHSLPGTVSRASRHATAG